MSRSMYPYYERELQYFRDASQSFAETYPAAAGRLRMDSSGNADPHVERLIQSFSLIGSRIHKRLDDDLPEVTDALLGILYPHYLRPIPSMAVLQLDADPANIPANGLKIERGTAIRTSPIGKSHCRFQTCYDTTVWPIEVADAHVVHPPVSMGPEPPETAAAAIQLSLRCSRGKPFSTLNIPSLRFHLDGHEGVVGRLYQSLMDECISIAVKTDSGKLAWLDPQSAIQPVGFDDDQAMLPYPSESFAGYRLLTEFFAFSEKFNFFDLVLPKKFSASLDSSAIEIWFYMREPLHEILGDVNKNCFRMGCTPVVNLFEKICEPIQLTHQKHEYRVVPDTHQRDATEVYSVQRVDSARGDQQRRWRPFFDLARRDGQTSVDAYWHLSRRQSTGVGDNGTDVFLQLVDDDFDPWAPDSEVITVRSLCTNRDLASQIRHHIDRVTWHVEAAIPVRSVRCLRHPTAPLRPPTRRQAHWNLISHLTLGHRYLHGAEGLVNLKELLRLYDFSDPQVFDRRGASARQMIDGILDISSRHVSRQVGPPEEGCFARGMQLTITIDEEKYAASGAYLFSSVLDRFLGLYSGINSFTETRVRSRQRDTPLCKFRPRMGEAPLI
jgi:type VI secretion system protein ImpG